MEPLKERTDGRKKSAEVPVATLKIASLPARRMGFIS